MQISTNAGDKLCITPTAAMQISTNQFLTTVATFFPHAWENIHSIFIMDKERFIHFRADFVKFIDLIKKGNDIDSLLNSLLLEYQELTCEHAILYMVR